MAYLKFDKIDKYVLYWSLWLVIEHVFLYKYSYFILYDSSELYMHMAALGESQRHWSPLLRAGTDLATSGSASSVARLLFAWLPVPILYSILMLTAIAGGTWSIYRLVLARMGGEDKVPAALAAALFGGCAIHVNLVSISFALMPVVLLCITRLLDDRRSAKKAVLALIACILTVGIGFPSNILQYFSVSLVSWFILVDRRTDMKSFIIIFAFAAFPIIRLDEALALFSQLGDSYYYYTRSPRTLSLIDLLIGDSLAFNLVKFAALLALPTLRRKNAWLVGSAAICVGAVVALPLFGQAYSGGLSALIHSFSASKILTFILLPHLCVAAGHGIGHLSGLMAPRWRRIGALGLGLVLAGHSLIHKGEEIAYDWLNNGNYVRNLESPVLKELAAQIGDADWPWRVEPIFLYPGHLQAYGLETASGDTPSGSRRYYEFWSAIMEPWIARDGGPKAVWPGRGALLDRDQSWPAFRDERFQLVISGTSTAASYSVRPMDQLYRLPLLSLANVRYFVSREPLAGPGLVELRRAPAPWGALSTAEKVKVALRENFQGRQWLYVYRNDLALPRFFTVSGVKSFEDGRATLDAMAKASVEELGSTLFVDRNLLPPDITAGENWGKGTVRPLLYSGDRIELEVEGMQPMILVATNTFSRYWHAAIDGNRAPLFPADHTFWGVKVGAGRHRVTFEYCPDYLPWKNAGCTTR
jgi:hypothetical protein